jgi:hypothetical protein
MNFIQMKKDSRNEAWVIYGCTDLSEAKKFSSEDDGETLMLTDEEIKEKNIKLDYGVE